MTLRSFLLAATALSGSVLAAHAGDLAFAPVAAPADDAAKRQVSVSASATMDGTETALAYHPFFRSGDTSPVEHHFNPQRLDDAFPREVVATCMIVDVKSKASTCLLTYSLRELLPGDTADMLLSAPRTAGR